MNKELRVRSAEPTISENLTLFHAEHRRRLKNIRRDLRRLEWRARLVRLQQWWWRRQLPQPHIKVDVLEVRTRFFPPNE